MLLGPQGCSMGTPRPHPTVPALLGFTSMWEQEKPGCSAGQRNIVWRVLQEARPSVFWHAMGEHLKQGDPASHVAPTWAAAAAAWRCIGVCSPTPCFPWCLVGVDCFL